MDINQFINFIQSDILFIVLSIITLIGAGGLTAITAHIKDTEGRAEFLQNKTRAVFYRLLQAFVIVGCILLVSLVLTDVILDE